jgi:hypothetical protein
MGCNCKQPVNQAPKPKVVNVNGVNEINDPIPPPYTRESIERCDAYFISRDKTLEEKNWVINFHNQNFAEQFPQNYNGDGWVRLKQRIQHLSNVLTGYEERNK